ncbi:protein MAIN-LIKE 2-like [Phragmites australis]|uniref:protein MAIN-LIKE 2-like n=1 Tax=Phragmites australis TaxID=29695 RepID=UPI002D78F29A|nr:protein MAIN-LIKE 2-like [Phragmites australis]
MTPTLQDVSYLLGLPCAGAAVGVIDMQADWMNDMHQRFGPVERKADAPPYVPEFLADARGPTKKWILQFQPTYIHPQANAYAVSRHLEAYLLWLFGWVMFTSGQGHLVTRTLVPYARSIADAHAEDVPQFSWALAVLAATYRALCDACMKKEALATFAGCPLLLQLWSYEHFAIGRPVVDRSPYPEEWYGHRPIRSHKPKSKPSHLGQRAGSPPSPKP